jgi:hypothetical protein
MEKDTTKIGIFGHLAQIPISFSVVGLSPGIRMHKWRGLGLPLVLLWGKLCRIGPIGSRPELF